VAEKGELTAGAVAIDGEVVTQDGAGAGAEGQEARQQAQQGRLAGAVGPGDENDLPFGNVEIDSGQGREPAQQADGGSKVDCEPAGSGGRRQCHDGKLPGKGFTTVYEGGGTAPRRRWVPTVGRRRTGTLLLVDRVRSALSAIGAALTGSGVLILLFVAYQLWGTGLYTSRQQGRMRADFNTRAGLPSTTTTTGGASTAPPPKPAGQAVAIIRIPKIGVDWGVVNGVSLPDLRNGPGHYPQTPLPGETGNAAIAGHRTTYGAPFNRLDELAPGDLIEVTTLKDTYTYKVDETKVVKPSQVEVLDPTPDARLTLTTCNPKYSAAQRLVVISHLAPGEKATAPAPTTSTTTAAGQVGPPPADTLADAGLSSGKSKLPTILWGIAAALVGLGWWWAVRRRRHWTTYVLGGIPFLVFLFFFYAHLELLLPANF
jgi:sortase A